jgi:hypothetical protein
VIACRSATVELQHSNDMPRLRDIVQTLGSQPGYALMRGAARFEAVRAMVGGARRVVQAPALRAQLVALEPRLASSPFAAVDRASFVHRLEQDGIALGLTLPPAAVAALRAFADTNPCYADRQPGGGFDAQDLPRAQAALGKPILVAQYFNAARDCAAIGALVDDPVLQWIAARYLQSVPAFVGANLWWTFPVQALEADRDRHAHLFHRDVDDFRFFKFFFYLTDVRPGDGAHVCVIDSHRRPPATRGALDRWNIRRYGDDEIARSFAPEQVREICGPAGTGFAENTLCVHKGLTPTREPRLLLQLQYALFDYGVMHDRRPDAVLRRLV